MLFEEMAARAGFDPRRTLWRVSEVAEITGVPKRTLYDEILAGRLTTVRLKHRARPQYLSTEGINLWLREEWTWM